MGVSWYHNVGFSKFIHSVSRHFLERMIWKSKNIEVKPQKNCSFPINMSNFLYKTWIWGRVQKKEHSQARGAHLAAVTLGACGTWSQQPGHRLPDLSKDNSQGWCDPEATRHDLGFLILQLSVCGTVSNYSQCCSEGLRVLPAIL